MFYTESNKINSFTVFDICTLAEKLSKRFMFWNEESLSRIMIFIEFVLGFDHKQNFYTYHILYYIDISFHVLKCRFLLFIFLNPLDFWIKMLRCDKKLPKLV